MFINKYRDILRMPADEEGSGVPAGSEGEGQAAASGQSGSMFKAGESGGAAGEGSQASPPADNERPEWLLEKFKTPEEQAKGYAEMSKSFLKKTDDLRAEVKDEAIEAAKKSFLEERGVPEDIGEYEAPEDLNFKITEELDGGLRDWAKEQGVGKEGYQKLLQLYNNNFPNPEKEKAALGENAESRIDDVNRWLNANVDKSDHKIVEAVMTTAAGVEFMERMRDKMGDNNFAPGDTPTQRTEPLTRGEIREMQGDPRFGEDPDYTAKVRGLWKDFAARNPQ